MAAGFEQVLRDLADALASGEGAQNRNARMRAARQVVVRHCLAVLGSDRPETSVGATIKLAIEAPEQSARRTCAVLLVHALAVRDLVPASSMTDVCALVESALHGVLLRCGYPFGGSTEERMRVLERLHRNIDDLMEPLQPTFPNWQGLYAG
jgi:hypothetical protein